MELVKLIRASIFTALAVGLGFSLLVVPNIELITVTIFLAGLTLGVFGGALVGGVAEFIFSAASPFGSGLVYPPLLIAQVLSMILIGVCGGLLRPIFFKHHFSRGRIILLGITGFILTFIFDSSTTLSFLIMMGNDLPQLIALYISAIPFTLLHQASNALVFSIAIPKIVKYL